MPLRSSNVGGLVTSTEWQVIARLMGSSARVVSLLPLELAAASLKMFGKEPVTKVILSSLDLLPDEWASDEEESELGDDGGDDGGSGGDDGSDGSGGDGEDGNANCDGDGGHSDEPNDSCGDSADEESGEDGDDGGEEEESDEGDESISGN